MLAVFDPADAVDSEDCSHVDDEQMVIGEVADQDLQAESQAEVCGCSDLANAECFHYCAWVLLERHSSEEADFLVALSQKVADCYKSKEEGGLTSDYEVDEDSEDAAIELHPVYARIVAFAEIAFYLEETG